MDRLSTEQNEAMQQARCNLLDGFEVDTVTASLISATYRQAWKDCLNYQQPKINALLDYAVGKITRSQLEATVPEIVRWDDA